MASQAALELIVNLRGDADAKLNDLSGSLGKVGAIAGTAVVAGFAAAGAAAVAFGATSVNVAADFEAGMNRFVSVTGLSGDKLQEFQQLFLDMGAQTQFSAAQAQEAAIALAKGGIDPATIAAGGLENALALAAAGELELATAADITAKQLGVWASTGVDAAQVANLMAQAANASTVDVDELALGLANVGGVAKVAGLSFEETVQTMAQLAPGFSSAADAGTSLKAFLNNMIPTTTAARGAMEGLGLMFFNTAKAASTFGVDLATAKDPLEEIDAAMRRWLETHKNLKQGTEEFDKAFSELWNGFNESKFYDAQGAFVGMEAASRLLSDATKDLSEAERSLALETIFGSDAQRAAAIIAEGGAEAFANMGEAMAGAGSAADQAAVRNQGFAFALDSLKGSIETLQIIIGSALLPVMTDFINEALIPAVNWVMEVATALTSGNTSIESYGAAWQDAIGLILPLVGAYQSIISAVLPVVQRFIAAHGAEIQAFFQQTWAAIAEIVRLGIQIYNQVVPPILQAVAAFIRDHGAEIQAVLSGAWQAISAIVSGTLATIQGLMRAALAVLQGDWSGAWEAIKGIGAAQLTAAKDALMGVLNIIAGLFGTSMREIGNTWQSNWNNLVNIVKGLGSQMVAAGAAIIQGIIQGVRNAKRQFIDYIISLARESVSAIKSFFGIASPSRLMAEEVGEPFIYGLLAGMEAALPEVLEGVRSVSEQIYNEAKGLLDDVTGMIDDMQEGVLSGRVGVLEQQRRNVREMAKIFGDLEGVDPAIARLIQKGQAGTQGALDTALQEAQSMDAEAGAEWYRLRSQQILEIADLQRDAFEATTDAERNAIYREIDLLYQQQDAERRLFEERRRQEEQSEQEHYDDLIEQYNRFVQQRQALIEQRSRESNERRKLELSEQIEAWNQVISAIEPTVLQLQAGAGGDILAEPPPMRAAGGPVSAYSPYIVGERGPELFVPRTSGTIVPNGQAAGGITITIDARGADVGVEQRIQRAVETALRRAGITADARMRMA